MTGPERLRHDALDLADRYRHLLAADAYRTTDLDADRIDRARQRSTDEMAPGQLTIDDCLAESG